MNRLQNFHSWLLQNKSFAILLGLLIFVFFYQLGTATLWDVTEAEYALVLKDMVQTGDGAYLKLLGQPWLDKEPLLFWLAYPLVQVTHFSLWALRLVPTFFALASVFLIFGICKIIWNQRIAEKAALIFGVSLIQFVTARTFTMDTALVFFFLLATWFLVKYWFGKQELKYFYWAVMAVAVGTLVKGIILPVQLSLCFVPYYLFSKSRKPLPAFKHWLGFVALYAAVVFPWYFVQYLKYGVEYLNVHFGYYQFGRVGSVVDGQTGPWYYYLVAVFIDLFPFSGFLLPLLLYGFRHRKDERNQFLIFLTLPTFLFYSILQTKLPHYIGSVIPFLAVGIAVFWEDISKLQKNRKLLAWICLAVPVTLLILAVANLFFSTSQDLQFARPAVQAMLVLLLSGSVGITLLILFRFSWENYFRAIFLFALSIYFVFVQVWIPTIEKNYKYPVDFAKRVQENPRAKLYSNTHGNPYAAHFYANQKIMVLTDDELAKRINQEREPLLAFVYPSVLPKLDKKGLKMEPGLGGYFYLRKNY